MKKILLTDHKKTHLDILIQNVNDELDGNDLELSIVMKPNLKVMMDICSLLEEYKKRIVFVVQINSSSTSILKVVDPYSPYFIDRHAALKYAFENGFRTAVEADPMYDNMFEKLINSVRDYVTDYIHIDILTLRYVNDFVFSPIKQLLLMACENHCNDNTLSLIKTLYAEDEKVVFGENLEKKFKKV